MKNIFIPRNIEGRERKIKQMMIKQLDQKIINGDVGIDCKFISKNYIAKIEKINGNLYLKNCDSLLFLKNLKEVNGEVNCGASYLTTLEGCPKIVNGDFWCQCNKTRFKLKVVEQYCNVKGRIYA